MATWVKWSRLHRDHRTEGALRVVEGSPIFGDSCYLRDASYVNGFRPSMTLVSGGRHITGLFRHRKGLLSGDHNGKTLVLAEHGEDVILVLTDCTVEEGRRMIAQNRLCQLTAGIICEA